MRIAVVEIRDHHALSLGIQRHMDPTPLMTPHSLSTESLTTNGWVKHCSSDLLNEMNHEIVHRPLGKR